MLLDFPNGVFGQILVDLGNDTRLDIDVNALRRSAKVFGGATITSAGTFLARNTCSIAAVGGEDRNHYRQSSTV